VSTLHALLIGIDDYVPDLLPDGSRYPSLHGATRDAERVESFLRDQAGLTPERTLKLLSRTGEDGVPTEPPERRPTYANMVAAFKRLAAEAAPGDRVLVHYSGHGARLSTEYREVKGAAGQDEALVPCDIAVPGSRYLRDLELAVLVRLLVDRGLVVTLVLDCCHAGGAMRTGPPPGAVARKVHGVHLAPDASAVAERNLLIRAWRRLREEDVRRRNVSVQSWLPVARYALFAACRPEELAYELPFEKGEPQGALTYWLLNALEQGGFEQRCDKVQKALVAGVHGQIACQTPLFLGDGDRPFLGEAPARGILPPSPNGPMVLRVDKAGRVLLSWGQAQGARERARLILNGAVMQVRQVGAAESWAEVVKGPKPTTIKPGSQADVLPLQAVVRLLPPEPGNHAAEKALGLLRESLWDYRGALVEIDDEAEAPDLCVAVDAHGAYEIRDPDGSPFPNLAPLRTTDRGAAQEIVRRLEHLAKYRSLRTLENPEAPHWLEIGLELCGDDPSVAPVPVPSGGLDLKCDEAAILRIVNRSSLRLDFAVLDLAPDYSVTQVLPPRRSFSLLPLDAGEGHVMRLRGWLPPELQEGVDVLKIFATRGSVSYRGMQLPPLGRRDPNLTMRGGGLTPSEFPEEEWISAQVEMRVRR
jgi:hypothetical protein